MKPTTILFPALVIVGPSLVNAGPASFGTCIAACVAAAGVCHATSFLTGVATLGVGFLGNGLCHGAHTVCSMTCKAALLAPTP